ncbi:MAG TPA: hypothetical protein VI541_02010, partial [Actinomycetota bacterium]|nr:hypothetical protein [Actinomycetota bacterium]
VDPTTDTGRRINFLAAEMPRSTAGKPIDPTEWNRNDGFSPGSMVLTFVPGLDLHRTWGTQNLSVGGPNDPADHIADIGRYSAVDAPILIIDSSTGERWPFMSELDNNALTGPDERLLIIRPARNFLEGHRYLVGLRNLKDASGALIPAGPQFAAYRDGTFGPLTDPTFERSRRASVDGIINAISGAEAARGNIFTRGDLFLAWDFTIASRDNLSERVLKMRDHAFGLLGDTNLANSVIEGLSPSVNITTPIEISRVTGTVEGTIRVPNYLDRPAKPPVEKDPITGLPQQAAGGRLLYGLDDLPMQNPVVPTIDVEFVCTIPRNASVTNTAHPTIYGHGLLGSRSESKGGSTERDRERNFMPCATNWMGFAEYDIANAVHTLADPSNMPTMADRSQQGFVNFLYLGRAMAHPGGFAAHPNFKDANGSARINPGELFYDGNSQGGIMGGAYTALAVDSTRSVLGVTGMNYSTLLNRSVDWEGPLFDEGLIEDPEHWDDHIPSYSSVLYTMFPDKKEQQLIMGILQMLWDRAEADGYAQHMTSDPLPNTPAHQVLMHVAYGDFQVTNFSAEVEARTIGARILDTALLPGRHWATDPFFGLTLFPRDGSNNLLPWNGSALVYWDSGNLLPPNANIPPDEAGGDPHEDPRRDHSGGDQKAHFWLTGNIIDVRSGGAYLTCNPNATSSIPRGPMPVTDWCV